MQPNLQFLHQTNDFWALIRLASESFGYSLRNKKPLRLRRFTPNELRDLSTKLNFKENKIALAVKYLNFRANLLEQNVFPLLMDRPEAKKTFETLIKNHKPTSHLPFNKQKKKKDT